MLASHSVCALTSKALASYAPWLVRECSPVSANLSSLTSKLAHLFHQVALFQHSSTPASGGHYYRWGVTHSHHNTCRALTSDALCTSGDHNYWRASCFSHHGTAQRAPADRRAWINDQWLYTGPMAMPNMSKRMCACKDVYRMQFPATMMRYWEYLPSNQEHVTAVHTWLTSEAGWIVRGTYVYLWQQMQNWLFCTFEHKMQPGYRKIV